MGPLFLAFSAASAAVASLRQKLTLLFAPFSETLCVLCGQKLTLLFAPFAKPFAFFAVKSSYPNHRIPCYASNIQLHSQNTMRLLTAAFPLIALLATLPSTVQAADEPTPNPPSDLTALRDAALADDYAYQQVAHLTDNLGPRPSGSPQAEAAVEYVAGELRRLGLEVRLEDVRVPRWVRGVDTAELTTYPGQAPATTQKILLTALGGNTSTPAERNHRPSGRRQKLRRTESLGAGQGGGQNRRLQFSL